MAGSNRHMAWGRIRTNSRVEYGKMHVFSVEILQDGGVRFRAYGDQWVPLTTSVSPWGFCFWALATQPQHHTPISFLNMVRGLEAAGLNETLINVEQFMARRWPAQYI